MRIFIVGATGVLGRALLPLLLQQGHTICTLVRSPSKASALQGSGLEIVQGDLLVAETQQQLPTLVAGCDAVVHIATAIPKDMSAPWAWDATTQLRTTGTRVLLQAALALAVPSYIQQSIVMAYPDGKDSWLDEQTPLDSSPRRAMVCAPVITMEAMLRAVAPERLRWCILRGGTFVGAGTAQDDFVASLRTRKVVIPCDGSNFISFVHVTDMAEAIAAALHRAPAGSTFNIVGEVVRYGAYADHITDMLELPHPPRDLLRPCPPSFRCTNEAARTTLGWIPRHSTYEEVK